MMAMSTVAPRAFAVWWKDLERWVIPTALLLRQTLPPGWERVRVGSLVKQVTDRIKTEPEKEYKMAGVKWYGEGVFHRETVRGDSMSANQVTRLVPGALIYNRLFAWKASFAVVPTVFDDCYVSNEFPQFIMDPSLILPEYLYLFCTRNATIRAVNAASTGSAAVSRNRFKEVEFIGFEIALPPLTEQKTIVARWLKAKNEILDSKKRVEELERGITNAAIASLGLKQAERRAELPKAFSLWWKDLSLWGAGFNRLSGSNTDLLRSQLYHSVRLGDAAYINPSTEVRVIKNGMVTFVPMETVSDTEGKIVTPQIVPLTKVAKGYTRFQENDVIWAKITPCMQNGKSAVAYKLQGGIGFGSTEFHVIRSRDCNAILPEYIWILLRLDSVRKLAMKYFVGSAGQQRVPRTFLEDLVIPLPSLDVQKQIIERVMDGRTEIVRERQAADRLTKEINAEIEALILGSKTLREQ
ncbi:MAG: restriction endonuclease subunit S [bacterium]